MESCIFIWLLSRQQEPSRHWDGDSAGSLIHNGPFEFRVHLSLGLFIRSFNELVLKRTMCPGLCKMGMQMNKPDPLLRMLTAGDKTCFLDSRIGVSQAPMLPPGPNSSHGPGSSSDDGDLPILMWVTYVCVLVSVWEWVWLCLEKEMGTQTPLTLSPGAVCFMFFHSHASPWSPMECLWDLSHNPSCYSCQHIELQRCPGDSSCINFMHLR